MTLIAIGHMGDMTVYMNMTREQAIAEYLRENDNYPHYTVKELTVTDRFDVYDIWSTT